MGTAILIQEENFDCLGGGGDRAGRVAWESRDGLRFPAVRFSSLRVRDAEGRQHPRLTDPDISLGFCYCKTVLLGCPWRGNKGLPTSTRTSALCTLKGRPLQPGPLKPSIRISNRS